jgi:uncharacterized protein YbjT (DUF2867 family)
MILVTGATGNVGSSIVDELLTRKAAVRAFTRDAAKAAAWGSRVELALGDLTQPSTFARALQGIDAVFLMNGALDSTAFRQLLAEAAAHGRPRIVFLSSLFAADPNSPIGHIHKDKEDGLVASGLPFAIVRAGGFMSNVYQWIGSIQAEGVVYNPMGDGLVASIDPADIAAVAVHALTAPVLTESLFEVTGSELLNTGKKVEILARVLGKPLRIVEVEPEAAVQGLLRNGIPPQVARALGQSFAAIRAGQAIQVTDTVRRVTGRPPRSFEAWAHAHAARFA